MLGLPSKERCRPIRVEISFPPPFLLETMWFQLLRSASEKRSEERRVGNGDWSSDVCSSDLPVSAQVFDTGTIAGLVTDPSGAAVPHATITITNVGTSIERTLQTDQGGNFVSSALPSGNYVVSATAIGFGKEIGRASCRER